MGHSPIDVAQWTPLQQLAVLNPKKFADKLFFATDEDYEKWLTSQR